MKKWLPQNKSLSENIFDEEKAILLLTNCYKKLNYKTLDIKDFVWQGEHKKVKNEFQRYENNIDDAFQKKDMSKLRKAINQYEMFLLKFIQQCYEMEEYYVDCPFWSYEERKDDTDG